MSHSQLSHQVQVYQVHDVDTLYQAISIANSGDTITLAKDGDYGNIRIINKSGIRITARSKQLSIKATLSLDGACSDIIIENLNIWNDNQSKKQIILIGTQSKNIIVRHCLISSFPVSMNTLRDRYAGEPKNWINGIRVLSSQCHINDNILVNIHLGIQANGAETTIENNVIQYFSDDAIRVQQNNIKLLNNHIYDSVLSHAGDTTSHDAIKLIPPEKRFEGGELRHINVVSNVIRSQNRSTSVPKHMQGTLHGITANDGYFVDILISKNSLVLNSNVGIVLNGANRLALTDNKVIASPSHHLSTPGITLYLTCTYCSNPTAQKWLTHKDYSVQYSKNQAPIFNIPTENYVSEDLGHNHFTHITHDLTQNIGAVVIGDTALNPVPNMPSEKQSKVEAIDNDAMNASLMDITEVSTHELDSDDSVIMTTEIPVVSNPVISGTQAVAPLSDITSNIASNRTHRDSEQHAPASTPSPRASVLQVANTTELLRAIRNAVPGDTILITRSGDYGRVRITNKNRLRIKSFNTDIPIRATFIIDGSSNIILLENMQLWNDDIRKRQIIITGKSTNNILIRHCIISTVSVNRNTMRRRYHGNPQNWINGIRMLGSNGQIISNHLMNLKMGVSQSGPNTLIQHNLVQFFSEDAIRASDHGVKVLHNNIYDSVAANPGQNAHKDAIQLIPPYERYNAGKLVNVQIIGNIIQSFTNPSTVPKNQRGIVQGIFGSDGYFISTVIRGNTVMVNSDHGITLNGVRNLELVGNNIVDLSTNNQFTPGIKLYLTRVSQYGRQTWLANRPYSLRMRYNQAPTLNIPNEAYKINDLGENRFIERTQDLARGHNPVIIRKKVLPSGIKPDAVTAITPPTTSQPTMPINGHSASGTSTFLISNKDDLHHAITSSAPGDTLIFEESGHYGLIRISNKTGIRLKAANTDVSLNANFLIDGQSKNIIIENLNIWFSEKNWKPAILTGPETTNITIRNCLISSYQVTRNNARTQMTGTPNNWVTGIWLRGNGNEIVNNHITNVRVGITINGIHTLLQNNLIQYYTDTGIRVINNNVEIVHNNIYDAITRKPNSKRLATGIQLIPAANRFEGGTLKNIKITHNVIQARNSGSPTADDMQAQLQGITLHDGYISGMVINSNTVIVNTEYGIALNGASGLSLNGNRVFDSRPTDNFIPGIRLYYTRTIDIKGNRKQTWRSGRNYSVSFSHNQAAVFNIPASGYEINDGGDNRFGEISHNLGRGIHPIIAH